MNRSELKPSSMTMPKPTRAAADAFRRQSRAPVDYSGFLMHDPVRTARNIVIHRESVIICDDPSTTI